MGLFFNSGAKEKKNLILRDIAIVNSTLKDIASILDNQGVNTRTVEMVGSKFNNVMSNIERISSTVQGMTDSQLRGFDVPWIDGRYLGIMMWIASMAMMSEQIAKETENYVKRGY